MLLEPKRNWLKASDVKDGDVIKFLTEGEWRENTKFPNPDGTPKQQFIMDIDYQGETKTMTVNKTSRDSLVLHLGKETKSWIGKEARIVLSRLPTGKQGIFLDPI